MDRQIEYVGGQPERPPVRPWWLLAVVPLLLILGIGAVFAGPGVVDTVRSLSQGALPYTIQIKATWSAADQVVGSPATMALAVKNTGTRTLNGIQVRLSGLGTRWTLVSATPDGQVTGTTARFSQSLRAGESETLEVHLMPVVAGNSQIRLLLTPAAGGQTIRMVTDTGPATGLNVAVAIRDATASDLAARAHLYYNDANLVNESSRFRMHIDNSGVVRITQVTVHFSQLPSSFELQTSTAGSLSADGQSVSFPVTLDPGEGIDLDITYVPHQTGAYRVALQFYLQNQTDPIVLADGTRVINVPITVH